MVTDTNMSLVLPIVIAAITVVLPCVGALSISFGPSLRTDAKVPRDEEKKM